jgi:ATP adenylyltransferase
MPHNILSFLYKSYRQLFPFITLMKNIWAPWRKEFILSKKEENCFFCEAIKDNQDRKNLVLYRGKECFCILNKYPYNNGHLMVTPNLHKELILGRLPEQVLKAIYTYI